jgi:DNA-binding transcriptional LysR family regulator
MYPNLNDLRYFIEISQTGNVSQAAVRLGVTQPTLSQAVVRLENNVGAKLFQRSKKGMDLTPAGRTLVVQSRKLIQDWEAIQASALSSHSEVKGQYKVGCHPSVALYTLPQVFSEWMSENPELEIKLVHNLSRKILDGIISTEIDIGVVVNPVQHPDLIIKKACEDEVGLWAADKKKAPQNEDVLIADPDLLQTQDIMKKIKKAGYNFKRFIESSSLEVVAELTKSGAGIGILPGRVANRVGHLKSLSGPKFKDEICIVFRAESRSIKTIQVLSQSIEKALTDPPK